jgi:hypothetical protein
MLENVKSLMQTQHESTRKEKQEKKTNTPWYDKISCCFTFLLTLNLAID